VIGARRMPLLCAALPLALASALAVLLRPELRSLITPLLGPFAGELYGHGDCTLANLASSWSAIGGAALALAILASSRLHASPRAAPRRASHALLALATSHWALLALLSLANTLS
jgi:hypothetical protein